MTPTEEDGKREMIPDQAPDREQPDEGDEDGKEPDWQDEVEIETEDSPKVADADLDPTLGYDITDADGGDDRSIGAWLWILLALVVLAVAGWWWWSNRTQPQPTDETPSAATRAATTEPRPAAAVELPELSASDDFVRQVVAEVAAHPALTRWLAHDRLVRRFVGAVEVVGEGSVPRDNLDFLSPESGFEARAVGTDRWRASTASHQRFEELLQVLQLIDPADAARIVGTITPLADEARRDLGYPEGGFRGALDRAVAHLVRVSPQLAPESLVREGEIYLYEDPNLEEGLSPAQKALLRLGPEQAAWVQAWLHRFHDALSA